MYLTDVTIREAGQLPGRAYDFEQKVDAAKTLDDLGLEYVQATFPATNETDQAVTRHLASTLQANVVTLARATTEDVDACLDAGADVIEVFGTVSELHLDHVVHQDRTEMIDAFSECVERVRDGGAVPHITLTDAFRTDRKHLLDVYERLPDVEVISLADTVGIKHPREVEQFLDDLTVDVTPSRIGVHFHDDLGVATANLLIAREFGVQRGDVSVAALGERAGNAALEEVVINAVLAGEDPFGVNIEQIIPTCHDVLTILDEDVNPRKAILGREVLEHEAGIHTQAMLEDPSTFEPFDPSRFGGHRRLLFGEQTGRSGIRLLLERVDAATDEETVDKLAEQLRIHGPIELDDALDLATTIDDT